MTQQTLPWQYDQKHSYAYNLQYGPFGNFDKEPKYRNIGKPQYDFFGTKVYSLFGIAAGPLPRASFVRAALDRGFDIVTFKTVRSNQYPCHSSPNVFPLESAKFDPLQSDQAFKTQESLSFPLTITNSFGIPSFEPDVWQKEIKESYKAIGKGQALLVAFQGTLQTASRQKFIADHVKGIGLLLETGAKVIEINLSCPNEGHSNFLCYDIETSKEIIQKIRNKYGAIKLIVKITYFKDDEHLRLFVKEIGSLVEGITAINTIAANIVNQKGNQAFPGPKSRLQAGVSGQAIKHLGVDMVKRIKLHRQEFGLSFKIIGVGGVQTAKDFHDYLKAGADFVMGLTGVMWNPDLAAEIKKSLH
ncbi:MAG TPA: hypothetical protein VMR28_00840 [Candidatus Saccharimonadales bacterium]|nr:hypothetical protein [Candidatus Saccharimonadales bacterium]